MRIVFMGTPDFAVPSLRKLVEEGHEIVGVITQPDKPKGRGYQLVAPPVKEAALLLGIPVFQPAKMKDGEALRLLEALCPQLIVVVAYGKLLPKEILELPPLGCVNLHGSLLPKYRGAGPIQWSVINGDALSGVTTMYMAEGLDSGDMILKEEIPIGENESYGALSDRLAEIGASLLCETLRLIAQGTAPREAQDNTLSSYAPMLNKEIARLDFTKPAAELHHLICGLSPWPVAYTSYEGKLLKIHQSRLSADSHGRPGEVLPDKKHFLVACGQGALELIEVQLQGGKRMQGSAFLAGRRPRELGETASH